MRYRSTPWLLAVVILGLVLLSSTPPVPGVG